MANDGFEFDVTMTVRRRMALSGPKDRETARDLLKRMLEDSSLNPSMFSVRDGTGHAVERIISNDVIVEDAKPNI